jgi:3-oxoacyl-[acyl-carrier-protein] synthase-3
MKDWYAAMSTTLEAVAAQLPRWRHRTGHRLAVNAAGACLRRAHRAPGELELLINVGIYHERNLGEPAHAALLQEDLGANPEDPHPGKHGTFSFDIANGVCGTLTALQVADGFLRAGTISTALILAGDVDPGHGAAHRFPFEASAGALLVGWQPGSAGLQGFHWEREARDDELFSSTVAHDGHRNRLRVVEHPSFAGHAATWAGKAVAGLLAEHDIVPDEVDLVVAAPASARFISALPGAIGIDNARLVAARATRSHTAALHLALAQADAEGRLRAARTTVLVAAGAGIVAGAALIRR